MSGGLVDDYLADLLGAAAAGTMGATSAPAPGAPPPATPEPVVTVPALPDKPGEEISDDEFEALLDSLHGSGVPGTNTPLPPPSPAVVPAALPAASASADAISDDEFEALLDSLHGGQPPGALAAAASVAVAAARATRPAADAGNAPRDREDDRADDRGDDRGESWRGQERRTSLRSSRWLRLRVHGFDYGVELLKVQEVLLPVGVLAMRDTDPALLGVMNLRGIVVPVLDLGLWLGLEEVEDGAQTRYVVLEQNGECLALKVSAVLDVHAIADGQVEPAEHTLASPASAMLRGIARLNSQPVILLDAVGLLG